MTVNEAESRQVVVLASRQVTAVVLAGIILVALVACIAYVAGRSITAAQYLQIKARSESEPPKVIIVDPLKEREAPKPVVTAPPKAQPPVPAPPSLPVPAAQQAPTPAPVTAQSVAAPPVTAPPAPPLKPADVFRDPAPGTRYIQAGAVDRGVAAVFVEYLSRKGFTAFAAPGPDPKTFRVLVGPLAGPEEIAKTRAGLEAEGFPHFLRSY